MDNVFLFVSSIANLFIAGVFLGLSWKLLKRSEEEGTVIWVDLGKTLVMIGGCLTAQSLVIAAVANLSEGAFKLLWLIVFILFATTGFLVARWCFRTNKMLSSLLGGGGG